MSLIAAPVDNTSAFSGAFLITDGQALADSISSGNWIEGGMAAFSTVLNTAAAIMDPIGTLIANGLGWLLDHIEPLKGWLNDLTGNASEVAAFAATWGNVANRMNQLGATAGQRLGDLDDLAGASIDAYRAHVRGLSQHLTVSGQWSGAVSTGLQMASTIVQITHDLVRDTISQIVGMAVSAALTAVATLGLGLPAVAVQVGARVSALVPRISKTVTSVVNAISKLRGLISELTTMANTALRTLLKWRPGAGGAARLADDAADVLPSSTGLDAPRIPSQAEFDDYLDSLSTRDAAYGSPGARDFQQTHAGPNEYKIGTADDEIWADGLKYDPASGGVVAEAKYVDQPGGSSIYEGTAPSFILDKALAPFDDEMQRYVAAIADPTNPLTRLDVVVSTPAARDFLGARIELLMDAIRGSTGVTVDWTISVGSSGT